MVVAPKAMPDEVVCESWGSTQIKTIRFQYTWTISNFTFYCNAMDGKIESPTFSNGANSPGLAWNLQINPNGWYSDGDSDIKCMSLYLHLVSCNVAGNFETNFKLSILNTKSEDILKFEDNKLLFEPGKFYGINSFIEKGKLLNEKADLFPDDKLTIFCEITVAVGRLNILEKFKPLTPKPVKNHMAKDLEILLETPSYFSDVTLISEGKEFRAHKAILAARSAGFKDMFERDDEEGRKNRFEMKDMNHNVLNEILQYIYADESSDLKQFRSDLLIAAENYGLDGLKSRCVDAMCTNLSVENAAKSLLLGDTYDHIELKAQAKYYICAHAQEVIKTPGWKAMTNTHPHLVTEIVSALATSQFLCIPAKLTMPILELENVKSSTSPKTDAVPNVVTPMTGYPTVVMSTAENSIFPSVKLENMQETLQTHSYAVEPMKESKEHSTEVKSVAGNSIFSNVNLKIAIVSLVINMCIFFIIYLYYYIIKI